MTRKRIRYFVRITPRHERRQGKPKWSVYREGATETDGFPRCAWSSTKIGAVFLGRALARDEHARGTPTQLIVCNRLGQFQFEWTYGGDPERHLG